MLSNEQWEEKQEELDELIELRQLISNRIHILRIEIAQKSKQKEVYFHFFPKKTCEKCDFENYFHKQAVQGVFSKRSEKIVYNFHK